MIKKGISIETNIGFGIIFSVSFWACVNGKLPFLFLLLFPIAYVLMYIIVRVFIFDKRNHFNILLSGKFLTVGDIVQSGRFQKAIVLKINGNVINVFAFKGELTKWKLRRIKASCWLRNALS